MTRAVAQSQEAGAACAFDRLDVPLRHRHARRTVVALSARKSRPVLATLATVALLAYVLRARGARERAHGGLDGMRVLDMTQYEAGPRARRPSPGSVPTSSRSKRPSTATRPRRRPLREQDYSAYFCAWNANKRSVALDLRTGEGRDLLLGMAPNFDVFVETTARA